jgi:hypothetical protein
MYILNTLRSFFVGRRKLKLVLRDYQMGLLFILDPKIAGCGKKSVEE